MPIPTSDQIFGQTVKLAEIKDREVTIVSVSWKNRYDQYKKANVDLAIISLELDGESVKTFSSHFLVTEQLKGLEAQGELPYVCKFVQMPPQKRGQQGQWSLAELDSEEAF